MDVFLARYEYGEDVVGIYSTYDIAFDALKEHCARRNDSNHECGDMHYCSVERYVLDHR